MIFDVAIRQVCRIALVPYRWQDASATQGRDGLATICNRKSLVSW
jgi:hypothetical protein